MFRRIPFALVVACAIVVSMIGSQQAVALEAFFQGDISTDWAVAGNWWLNGAPNGFVPQEAGTFHIRPVIGTDDTDNGLNILNRSATISAQLPTTPAASNKSIVGGIALGLRELNYGVTPNVFFNPAPAAGALVGTLTISAGTLTSQSTVQASTGADGRILVGVDGRGFLNLTGTAVLNGPSITVAGENYTGDALGTSMLDLSGSSTLSISGAARFSRRLRVTGPSVNFSAGTELRFDSTNSYTAAITSATMHSPLKTTAPLSSAIVAGTLNVEFSGAAATRDPITSLGTTWDLIDVPTLGETAIDGNFSNVNADGTIAVAGLDAAHSAPLGAVYRIKKTSTATNTKMQLSYEQVLILTVNRDTGVMTVRNPYNGNIAIDAYSVTSARGSMDIGYAGLGAGTPNAGVWVKPTAPGGNTVNALSEVKEPDSSIPIGNQDAYDLTSVTSVSLGNGFNKTGVSANVANFGFDGEDLVFEYAGPGNGDTLVRGQIEYVGNKYENDLVLRVDPNTGEAFIKNDSQVTLKIDGYSIVSSTSALDDTGFSGLGAPWQTTSPPTAGVIAQTNLSGFTTLAPDAELAIGDISSLNFTTPEAQAGLSIRYLLAEGLTNVNPAGDYNNDGTVNAADYTTWRNNLGATISLTNQSPLAITRSLVDQEDYNLWKANFGAVAGLAPDTTFRTGSVVFDATAGAGGGGLAGTAVPEPTAGWLMLVGLSAFGIVCRSGKQRDAGSKGSLNANGESIMSNRNRMLTTVLAGMAAVLLAAVPAAATTQGIPLVNGDFSAPGPFGTKVVAFDAGGVPFAPADPVITLSSGQLAGGIPGWTFTGGTAIANNGETLGLGAANPPDLGDQLPGDSGTEGVGGGELNNDMILSTFDGKVQQTSTFNVQSITANQKYQIGFDARNIFTRGTTIDEIAPMAQLTVRLYYVDAGSVKQTIGSPLVLNNVGGSQRPLIEFYGNVPAEMALLTPAIGRPIGIEFDVTSKESDFDRVTDSWIGIDNVIMQVMGIKRGDLDGDGDVDLIDYAALRDNIGEAHTYEVDGELTGDYVVDLNDFRLFKTFYEAANPGAGGLAGIGVPEPSAFVLVMISLAGLACGFVRKDFGIASRGRSLLLAALAVSIALLTAASSRAELLAYDPFRIGASPAAGEYVVSTGTDPIVNPLAGQNPTIGPAGPSFFRDPWTIGSAGGTVVADSLSYKGTTSIGGAATGYGRTERYLTTPLDNSTVGTYYISFEANFGNTGSTTGMGYRAVEFFPPNVVPGENRVGDIGYNQYFSSFGTPQQTAATAKMQFNIVGVAQQIIQRAPDTYVLDGITHLMVLKFVMSDVALSDSISLYFDPATKTEPLAPTNIATGFDFTLGSIGYASFDNDGHGGTTIFDELRVATTYVDAVPSDLPVPGDTNKDELIDLVDYQAIISHMNQPGGRTLAEGDVTGDGKVTIADYRYWKERRTDLTPAGGGSLAFSSVPEPSSLCLMLATMSLVLLRRAVNTRLRNTEG